ncbi:unnamed protein product [Mytilus edulis]|uniref:Uncharacterized protein n=1 Tax=Mytilus edulis TaxID=6550 RepID=A0A8S3SNE9_MYTED|nr:unnamed protein product [Mytilus edulis]
MSVFKYEEEFPLLSSPRGGLEIKQLLSRPSLQQHLKISGLKKPSDMSEQVSSEASQVSVHCRPLGKTYKDKSSHKKDSTPLTSPLVHNGSISCKKSVYTGKQVSNNMAHLSTNMFSVLANLDKTSCRKKHNKKQDTAMPSNKGLQEEFTSKQCKNDEILPLLKVHIHVFGKSFTFISKTMQVKVKELKQFIEKVSGIKQNMQYLQTRAGTCLSTNDVIECTDNDILKLYQPGLGGVRESPVHPGDYCGPCSLCKKDSNYGYLHLGSKSYQLEFVDFVKSKHKISEKDCICKSCMLKLNRNFSHKALAEESLQTAKKPKLECALALCNSCTNTSVTRSSPLDTDELNTCFSVSLQEAQIESIFLCDGHYLKAYNYYKSCKAKCKICNLSLFKKYYANFDQIYLQQYMYEQGTTDKILTRGDVICKKCHSILYRYTGQQQHDKKVECVSPREYVSLILKQAVSGTLDIDIPAINKLALNELIKFLCTELMQDKALLLSEIVDKFQKFGGCFSSNLRQNQTRFILDKLQLIFSSNIDTDKKSIKLVLW